MPTKEPVHDEVHIQMDRKPKVSPNPTSGAALYSLGDIAAGYDLFRESRGPGDDELIRRDAIEVVIQPGDKLFSVQSSLNPGGPDV